MSAGALIFSLSMMVFVGILFGGLLVQLINDAKELRRIKRENQRYTRGEINQVDFIARIAEYEAAMRAEANRVEVLQEWVENCKAQAEADRTAKERARQKKQISDQLGKAKAKEAKA